MSHNLKSNDLKIIFMEKKKSEVLERLMKRLTPEYRENMKKKRIEHKNSLTSEYQLGYYVGEDIIHRDLPTISVEHGTLKVFYVTDEETIEYNKLVSEWFKKHSQDENTSKEEWNKYQEYRKMLIKKYLPNTLVCYRPIINITNMDEFKDGLISSLWNSDVCNYSLNPEDINIYDDDECYFTVIEFKLK